MADEVHRQRERLLASRARVLVGEFGRAVGTLASLGPVGLQVQELLLKNLDLAAPAIPVKTAGDRLAEFVLLLCMLSATLGKIAQNIYSLQQTDIDEVTEFTEGKVGSSAMPPSRTRWHRDRSCSSDGYCARTPALPSITSRPSGKMTTDKARHPRVHIHYTPTYSSWLNQVEMWFSKVERDVTARGIFTSVGDLRRKLMRYIRHHIKQPRPIKWTYSNPKKRIAGTKSAVTVH